MSAFYATNKEVKILSDKLDLLNTKLDLLNTKLDSDAEGNLKVRLSGTSMSLFGADISARPSASSVPVGTTFTLTNANLDTWISNGTDWVEV